MSRLKLGDLFSLAEVLRDAEFSVTLHPRATRSGAICYALNEAVLLKINRNPHIAAVITNEALAGKVAAEKGAVIVGNPQERYYQLHNHLVRNGLMQLHSEASIDPSAEVASSAILGRCVVIGPGVTINHGAVIGDYTIIGPGSFIAESALIGMRGMQNTKVDGRRMKVEWAGGVRIGENCEILASAVVQRPYHCEYTEIGDGAQISVKANIGHGVWVGSRTMIGGNSQIGGNARIGCDAWIGQSATIRDGIRIGDRAEIKMGSVVVREVGEGEAVSGNFASNHERRVQEFSRSIHD